MNISTPLRRIAHHHTRTTALLHPHSWSFSTSPTRNETNKDPPSPLQNISDAEIQSAQSYCLTLLRHHDSPSYLLQTFIPSSSRQAYIALRALNIDIARIADTTSAPAVASLRYQFWRDSISSSLSGKPPKEPVAILLAAAAANLRTRNPSGGGWSKLWLHRMINEREKRFGGRPFVDLKDLEGYAENTYSTLLYLTLAALPMHSVIADHVASHIGKAAGIVASLRGLPLLAFPRPANHHSLNRDGLGGVAGVGGSQRQGIVNLPLDVMASACVREEDVLRQGPSASGLRDAVFEVATRANDHLITAREMIKNLRAGRNVGHEFEHSGEQGYDLTPEETAREGEWSDVERAWGVYMQAVPTQLWLDRLEKSDFDVFNEALRRSDWRLPWNAYWAFRRKNI
ncbi:hypothetical protein M501DRAFT_992973 [Patellaria atrata CBS 101060]|uniref:Squalene/phytoene synthase n=1 Tax=Patellaria atrata CBS 101060 TaxID=1346257 RepID=A0A9P4SA62_9PEZI|nr:hypothetical protein M501DRAFT_992973 [Patellaria atrata CBS 101060]